MVAVDHLDAIGADVDPFRIQIARDHRAAGADVAPAVEFVPERRREREHIDFLLHILEHRAFFDHDRVEPRGRRLPLRRPDL